MTQEQFIKVLPAYIGCKAKCRFMGGYIVDTLLECEMWFDQCRVYVGNIDVNASRIKLILRSFDQMTEEEKKNFGNHMLWEDFTVNEFLNDVEMCDRLYNFNTAAKAINYLRSIGIDCDGLIDAGYAVKEEQK